MPEACFHAELIGTSPVRIACKIVKLFKFLQGPTQREHTTHVAAAAHCINI